jgi:two-component system response regulator PilR (NtrC family)
MKAARILVVDDELSMRQYLEVLLRRRGYDVVTAAGLVDARTCLADGNAVDLVVSDMRLGRESGLQVLREVRERSSDTEVILITAFGTPAAAVEAMREGAYDYICKPFDNEEMTLLVQNALEKRALREENRALRESFGGNLLMVGKSEAMENVRALVRKVAPSKSTVLVTGESGTGKELVARAIHFAGPRAGKPFLPVNCAALAEGVLESELFGHVKGAFTGAVTDRTGLLVAAGEGTVFLDEIGEIVPATQVKLLRVLQERTVKPVGSAAEVPFDARVVVATNRHLEAEVKAGRFREDLFYRLNVITIELPPLRSRPGDIAHLAKAFLAKMREELERPSLQFTPEALRILEGYPFPGNIRQLQNMVERAATLAESDELGPESLPVALRGGSGAIPDGPAAELSDSFSLERYLDDAERRYLLEALRKSDGVKTRAASMLGLTFRSFRYRLAKHGLGDPEAA